MLLTVFGVWQRQVEALVSCHHHQHWFPFWNCKLKSHHQHCAHLWAVSGGVPWQVDWWLYRCLGLGFMRAKALAAASILRTDLGVAGFLVSFIRCLAADSDSSL